MEKFKGVAETEPSKEKQGFEVRYGVVGNGNFEIIPDDQYMEFQKRVRESQFGTGSSEVVTLKNESDVQPWLEAMNKALQFRTKHGLSGTYMKTESMLSPDDRAELKRLDEAVKEFEVEK